MSRERFEEWAISAGLDIRPAPEGSACTYYLLSTEDSWIGWQARQPEIDNLCARLGALGVSNTKWKQLHADITKQFLEAQKETAKLKAELDKVKS